MSLCCLEILVAAGQSGQRVQNDKTKQYPQQLYFQPLFSQQFQREMVCKHCAHQSFGLYEEKHMMLFVISSSLISCFIARCQHEVNICRNASCCIISVFMQVILKKMLICLVIACLGSLRLHNKTALSSELSCSLLHLS